MEHFPCVKFLDFNGWRVAGGLSPSGRHAQVQIRAEFEASASLKMIFLLPYIT